MILELEYPVYRQEWFGWTMNSSHDQRVGVRYSRHCGKERPNPHVGCSMVSLFLYHRARSRNRIITV